MGQDLSWASATEIAQAVAAGETSALNVIDDGFARIEEKNPTLNALSLIHI